MNGTEQTRKAGTRRAGTPRKPRPTKGSRMLAKFVSENDWSSEEAARKLAEATGFACHRVQLWSWRTGLNVPGRRAAAALHKFAGVPAEAWDEK